MASKNPIPPKLYKNMLSDNYKQSKIEYKKILEFQRSIHNPICQKEDRYVPQRTRGNVLTQEYFKKMAEKPEKAHIKRIPIKSNLSSGVTVITEPNKPRGRKMGTFQKLHASSVEKRNLGKKIVSDNYKKFYYDDFDKVKLNQTDASIKRKKNAIKNLTHLKDHIYFINQPPKNIPKEKTSSNLNEANKTKNRIFPNEKTDDKIVKRTRRTYKYNCDHLNENKDNIKNEIKRLDIKPCNNDFKQVADEAKNNLNKRYYFDNTSSFW